MLPIGYNLRTCLSFFGPAVEQYREHNPYAKQYETTVQHTGRERLVGSSIEALGTNVSFPSNQTKSRPVLVSC